MVREISGEIATRTALRCPGDRCDHVSSRQIGYSEELAEQSQTVSLRSRLGHYADDFNDGKTADIIVNDIPFPR